MLQTIHAYAREKLADFGETGEISGRHARFFAGMAGEAEVHLRGGPQNLPWLQRLECEHENLRAALDWCLSGGDRPMGMQLAASRCSSGPPDHPSKAKGISNGRWR
jgi:predicted ATPase